MVHNELGRFCNEKQCGDAIEKYLKKFGIKYEREKVLLPSFEEESRGRNKVDFFIDTLNYEMLYFCHCEEWSIAE